MAFDPRIIVTLPGVPRRGLTRLFGALVRLSLPRWIRGLAWGFLVRRFGIRRASIHGDLRDYRTFLDVFTRPLPPDSRPLPTERGWLSPADGILVDHQRVSPEGSWVIKGAPYTTGELLPGRTPADYAGYSALLIHLGPGDYHRFHSPCGMKIEEVSVLPGGLQPVDPLLMRRSMRILARNRRIALHCRDERGIPFSILLVGAMNVGRMRFPFDPALGGGPWVPSHRKYANPRSFSAGDELGWFEMGSAVVLFSPPGLQVQNEIGSRCWARTLLLPETESSST